jgi:hypothetical protein
LCANEDLAFRKIINSAFVMGLKNMGKYLFEIRYKMDTTLKKCNTPLRLRGNINIKYNGIGEKTNAVKIIVILLPKG